MEAPSPDREKGDWRRSLYPIYNLVVGFHFYLHFLCIAPVFYGSTNELGSLYCSFLSFPGTKIVVICHVLAVPLLPFSMETKLCLDTMWKGIPMGRTTVL